LSQKKDWAGRKSIAMTRNTITKDGSETTESRYFISSLPQDVTETARAIRGHWMVESCHWHLDVTFREDANQTIEKQTAFNLNILRKLALNVLKIYEAGAKPMSLRLKRFAICTNPEKHLEKILTL
jgi:predicted transposase YbfD/YdcC